MFNWSESRKPISVCFLSVPAVLLAFGCVTAEKTKFRPPSSHPSVLRFKSENYFGNAPSLELRSNHWLYVDDRPVSKPTKEQWKEFLTVLSEVDVWGWYPTYINSRLADGIAWDIEIKWDNDYVHSVGSNDYPGCVPGMESCFANTPFEAVIHALDKLAKGALSNYKPESGVSHP